jgi:hypothetical protein
LGSLGVLFLASLLLPLALWPRFSGQADLQGENQLLRARLATIDRKLDEVDDAMKIVRLYDTHIRGLARTGQLPGTGPLDEDEAAELERLLGTDRPGLDSIDLREAPERFDLGSGLEGGVAPGDIRPVEFWAMGVEARVSRVVGLVSEVEPRLNTLVKDLEAWRTIHASMPSIWPLEGILSSPYGFRRSPFNRRWKFHTGIDVAAPRGSPILAPASGTVVFSGYYYGYGRTLEIDHGHGVHSRLAHATQLFFAQSDYVERGEIVATVGTTGRTTGPHLHYEILVNGQQVDPLDFLP